MILGYGEQPWGVVTGNSMLCIVAYPRPMIDVDWTGEGVEVSWTGILQSYDNFSGFWQDVMIARDDGQPGYAQSPLVLHREALKGTGFYRSRLEQ
jgi:hypothetical protein